MIARDDSSELAAHRVRAPTSFDAEEAPALVGRLFAEVSVHRWDGPSVTLPDGRAMRDYLLGRQAPAAVAAQAAAELPVPLTVTKRGPLVVGRR